MKKVVTAVLFCMALFWGNPLRAGEFLTATYDSATVTLPAHGMLSHLPSKIYTVPVDGWMVEAHWDVVNAPSYTLHHAWALTAEGNNYLCGIPGSAIFATGREHQRLLIPSGHPLSKEPYGRKLRKGQKFEIGLSVMLMNPDPWPYPKVKAQLTVSYYIPGPSDKKPTPLSFLAMNLGPAPHTNANFWCKNILGGNTSEYDIPPHSSETDRWKEPLEITEPMKVVAIGAHAHDYADTIRLLVNGKEAWRANLVKDSQGHLVEIPFTYGPELTLQPGDKINIEAKYTNPTDKPKDAMAFIFLVFEDTGKTPIKVPSLSTATSPPPAPTGHHHLD